MSDVREQLIGMSRTLGDERHDLAILGEGNTSARADADSFWVKASGTRLAAANEDTFVRVQSAPVLETMGRAQMDDEEVKRVLQQSTVEGARVPSIETFLHALCLRLTDVHFVGHTHPTAAVGLLCSQRGRELLTGGPVFPDQIVLLGPDMVYVPYADPGLPLARTVREQIDDFVRRTSRSPHVILLENHGVIALGSTAQQVINITLMLVKVCRVLAVSLAGGGPRPLTASNVQRIDQRPDELSRRAGLK